jgi:hypothetical protein
MPLAFAQAHPLNLDMRPVLRPAGFETTSQGISWALGLLVSLPHSCQPNHGSLLPELTAVCVNITAMCTCGNGQHTA